MRFRFFWRKSKNQIMKSFKYITVIAVLVMSFSFIADAQTRKAEIKDTAVSFRVGGACEMCKQRIEETIKTKGVRTAKWDVNSKILNLVYNQGILSLAKIHKRISEVGHDIELEKS